MTGQQEKTREKLERDDKGRLLPGQESLNPTGRPKGSFSLTTLVKNLLEEVEDPEEKRTRGEKLAEKMVSMAQAGNDKMMQLVWNYMDGKPKANVDIGVDRENVEELTDFFRALGSKPKPHDEGG